MQALKPQKKGIKDIKDLLIYEDDDVLVLNKPPHIATLNERFSGDGEGLLQQVRAYCANAQACHRLDKETSGSIIFAKHPAAYRHIAIQFEHRKITKIYHAVSVGKHEFEGVNVYMPILAHKTGVAKLDIQEGKEAETIFNTLKIYKAHTLIECYPLTGRLHQIRVHLAYLKAPIVHDLLYGGTPVYLSELKRKFKLKQTEEEQPLIQRVALHARAVNFEKPNGERVHIEAPYPKDMAALIRQLEINI
jgi:23S rRNA pseudouridine955/2504/2580 synthase